MRNILLWISALVFVIFMIFVLPNQAGLLSEQTGVESTPDTSLIYSGRELYQMAGDFGEEGREFYIKQRFTFDVIWPLVYGFFIYMFVDHGVRHSRWNKLILYVPITAVVFDFLENVFASIVFSAYPTVLRIMHITPIFTFLKWVFVGLGMILAFIEIFNMVKRKVLD